MRERRQWGCCWGGRDGGGGLIGVRLQDGVSQLITFSGLKNRVGGHNREVPAFGYAGRVYGVAPNHTLKLQLHLSLFCRAAEGRLCLGLRRRRRSDGLRRI